jgi:hypothetical protein
MRFLRVRLELHAVLAAASALRGMPHDALAAPRVKARPKRRAELRAARQLAIRSERKQVCNRPPVTAPRRLAFVGPELEPVPVCHGRSVTRPARLR